MLIGYARVSTIEQNFDLQLDALSKTGCTKIFQDSASGAKATRKGLSEALEYARDGDMLVVWRLNRLGRSLTQLIEFMNVLKNRGVSFRSLIESIDTTTPVGQFFIPDLSKIIVLWAQCLTVQGYKLLIAEIKQYAH